MSPRPRAAFQGILGAFSHEACVACLPEADPAPFPGFEQVFAAVRTGACGFAFVPSENLIAGPVPEVQALLPGCGLDLVAQHDWPIRLQLMAAPGATLASIRRVASHPMALKQCGLFLQAHGLEAVEAYDTAGAAAELAAQPDATRAAAAARAAAGLYGLTILAENIEDRADNITRFLVLRRPA